LIQGEIKSNANVDTQIVALAVDDLGMTAVKDQVKYLKWTKKPHHMRVHDWIKRIHMVNSHLPRMGPSGVQHGDVYVSEHFILENIPLKWKV